MTLRWKIAQAIEIRWWQRYLKNKTTQDYAQWKKQYWLNLLEECGLKQLYTEGGAMTLDAGCGPAGIFMVINQNIDALDPLLDEYEQKLPHFRKVNYPNVTFYTQTLESFDKKNKYDVVFCLNAINHVADLQKCFDILIDAVKAGGRLVVSIDAHNHSILKKIFQAIPGDVLHPHQYDLVEYSDMLTARGCSIDKKILYRQHFIFNYYILIATKKM
jgi:2-polyprenyl-3-methyl-5-hydroxy-6-metoxy-1,4-benzoquinol methylase